MRDFFYIKIKPSGFLSMPFDNVHILIIQINQDQVSGVRLQDQWSSGQRSRTIADGVFLRSWERYALFILCRSSIDHTWTDSNHVMHDPTPCVDAFYQRRYTYYIPQAQISPIS